MPIWKKPDVRLMRLCHIDVAMRVELIVVSHISLLTIL